MNPTTKQIGEKGARGIKITSPKIAIKRKNGSVTNYVKNGIASPANHKVAIEDPVRKISKKAIGIEKSPTNHEYHGKMPSSSNPKEIIEYRPLVENTKSVAAYID